MAARSSGRTFLQPEVELQGAPLDPAFGQSAVPNRPYGDAREFDRTVVGREPEDAVVPPARDPSGDDLAAGAIGEQVEMLVRRPRDLPLQLRDPRFEGLTPLYDTARAVDPVVLGHQL